MTVFLSKVRFYAEKGRFTFFSLLWRLRGNVRCSS